MTPGPSPDILDFSFVLDLHPHKGEPVPLKSEEHPTIEKTLPHSFRYGGAQDLGSEEASLRPLNDLLVD